MPTRLASLRPAARLRAIFEEIQDINGQRASLGMAPVDPFGGLDFGTAPAEAPAAVPFLSFPLRNPPAVQDQGGTGFETASVRLPQQPLRQPPVPQRRLSPDEVAAANDRIDPNTLFALSAISGAQERSGARQSAEEQERAEQAAKRKKLDARRKLFAKATARVRAEQSEAADARKARRREAAAAREAERKRRKDELRARLAKQNAAINAKWEKFWENVEKRTQADKIAREEEERGKLASFRSRAPNSNSLPEAIDIVSDIKLDNLRPEPGMNLEDFRSRQVQNLRDFANLQSVIGTRDALDAARADKMQQRFSPERVRFGFDRFGNVVVSLDGRFFVFNRREPPADVKLDGPPLGVRNFVHRLFPGLSSQDISEAIVEFGIGKGREKLLSRLPKNAQRAAEGVEIYQSVRSLPPVSMIGGRRIEEIFDAAIPRDDSVNPNPLVAVAVPGEDGLFSDFTSALIYAIRQAHAKAGGGPLLRGDREALDRMGIDTKALEAYRRGSLLQITEEMKRDYLTAKTLARYAKIKKDQSSAGEPADAGQ